MKKPSELTIADVEKAIGIPAGEWHGRCYEIATAIVKNKLVKGRAVYGHYTGHVAYTGFWKDKRGQPFQRHGWIVLKDERILDPTRWSFEDKKPYIALIEEEAFGWCAVCGHIEDEHAIGRFFANCSVDNCECGDFVRRKDIYEDYDGGANEFREDNLKPLPAYDAKAKKVNLKFTGRADKAFVLGLLNNPPDFTDPQVFWLANLPLNRFGTHAKAVYMSIEKAGRAGWIPIDNKRIILCGTK